MRIPSRRRQYGLRFDLTPLNDIVFLLIIFLVASPHFRPTEVQDDVTLPKVDVNQGDKSQATRRLEVTLLRSGEMRIGGAPVSRDELREEIRQAGVRYRQSGGEFELRLRADTDAVWGMAEPLIKMCVAAGIKDIKFAVLPSKSG